MLSFRTFLIVSPIISLLLLLLSSALPSQVTAFDSVVLKVGAGQTYSNPQDAVDAIPYNLGRPYVIKILEGVYTSSGATVLRVPSKATTSVNTITIEPMTTVQPVIDGGLARIPVQVEANYVTVRGLIIKDGNGTAGLDITGSNVVAESNYVYSTDSATSLVGIRVTESSNVSLRYNTVFNHGDYGILNDGADNTVIENNTVYESASEDNGTAGISLLTGATPTSGALVKHNIVSLCGDCTAGAAIDTGAGIKATVSKNNTFGFPTHISGSFSGSGNITSDPGFVSEESNQPTFLYTNFDSEASYASDFETSLGARFVEIPDAVAQYENDGETEVDPGQSVATKPVVFSGDVFTPVWGDEVRLEVEVRKVTQKFTGADTSLGPKVSVSSGIVTTYADKSSLDDKADYFWRARSVNKLGVQSDWVGYEDEETSTWFDPMKVATVDFRYDTDAVEDEEDEEASEADSNEDSTLQEVGLTSISGLPISGDYDEFYFTGLRPNFIGKSSANQEVTITVGDQECTTTSSDSGNYACRLSSSLSLGDHEVTIVVGDVSAELTMHIISEDAIPSFLQDSSTDSETPVQGAQTSQGMNKVRSMYTNVYGWVVLFVSSLISLFLITRSHRNALKK